MIARETGYHSSMIITIHKDSGTIHDISRGCPAVPLKSTTISRGPSLPLEMETAALFRLSRSWQLANGGGRRWLCAAARLGILYTMRERKINEWNM